MALLLVLAAPLTALDRRPASPPATRSAAAASSFTLFESGQVRPLAISPDNQHLFIVNTPDNCLEMS
jgi:hypothetical protein